MEVLTPELASVPAVSSGHSGRARPVERALSSTPLAEVLGRESVPVEAHFLDDLGADSMTMAQFCAPVRTRGDLPPVSIKDVDRHPTIAAPAASLPGSTPAGAGTAAATPGEIAAPTERAATWCLFHPVLADLADLVDARSATVVEQPGAAPPAPPAAELPPRPPALTGRTPE